MRQLNRSGIVVASRDVFLNPPPATEAYDGSATRIGPRELAVGVVVAGLALLEVVLLAGPAFAVSARRRQRQLALVAANGGTPAHVRRIVLADGVVLGLAGAGAGIGVGILAAFVARPFIEEYLANARAGAYRVFPLALAAIAGLAVVTGLLAALVPAFVTARQNVVAALAGRRGVTRSRKRWLFTGIGMVAAGGAVVVWGTLNVDANVMLAGLIIGELGMVLCTPSLVGLIARLGRGLPLAPRIALRDAARNRAAAAPAISAVMAAVAGSVAIGLYLDSERAQADAYVRAYLPVGTATITIPPAEELKGPPPTLAAVEALARATLPVASVHTLSTISCADQAMAVNRYCGLNPVLPPEEVCPYADILVKGQRELTREEMTSARRDRRCDDDPYMNYGLQDVFVDDGSALGALTGASADDVAAASAVLRSGGVVVRDARYVKEGRVTFAIIGAGITDGSRPESAENAPRTSFPAYMLSTGIEGGPPIVSPTAVAQTKLTVVPGSFIVATTRMPAQAESDRFMLRLSAANLYGGVRSGDRPPPDPIPWILAGAAALITLGAAGIATGLAAADGRADLSTLASVGASPRLRRGLSLSQSGVIAGLGSLLGTVAGLGAAVAVLAALNQRYAEIWPGPPPMPIEVPWFSLAMSLLVVPLIAILGAGLLTRSRLPIERRL